MPRNTLRSWAPWDSDPQPADHLSSPFSRWSARREHGLNGEGYFMPDAPNEKEQA